MIWKCFEGDKTGNLVKVMGTMKKEDYHSIPQQRAKTSDLCLIEKSPYYNKTKT